MTAVLVAASEKTYQKYAQLQTVKDGKAEEKHKVPPAYAALLDKFPE